ncbi:ankyrin repeat domain-containing protein 29-like [Haliotis cracherodii]|uniref:ankyrin repeat domain-containing protein 29-like n=1 Tax=Haliotis cracherodii TaxID=6455 RepID=UPI0039EA47C2
MPGPRAESQSPPRPNFFRTESRSPPRSTEHRTESKSPPTMPEDRAQSTSPPRSEGHQSRSESKSPLNQIEEGMTQMAFTRRSRYQIDSGDPQSAGSEKTQNSVRTRGKHRRATPTPSQRPAPAESDLHAACWTGNMAAMKRILSQGQSDIDGEGGLWRMTPVMTAAYEGQVDVVKILVSEGADVSLVDEDGNNTLHYACIGGDVETVKFVLSLHVVDINSRGEASMTPVMAAAEWGHRDVVELLVSEGADVSQVAEGGDNTLHYACSGGDVETVKCVLSLNVVDIDARNNDGQTVADVARRGGHQKVVKLL